MGIGISTFLIALGALLRFAVARGQSNGFNIHGAGIVLMIVGALGLAVSLIVFAPRARRTMVADDGVDDDVRVTRTTTTTRR